jgi:hypothetical protein
LVRIFPWLHPSVALPPPNFPVALLTEPRGLFLSFDHAKSHRLFLHRRFSRSSLSSLACPVVAPPSPFRSTSPVLYLNPNLVSAFLSTAR